MQLRAKRPFRLWICVSGFESLPPSHSFNNLAVGSRKIQLFEFRCAALGLGFISWSKLMGGNKSVTQSGQRSPALPFRLCAAQTGAAEFVRPSRPPQASPSRTQTEQRFPFDFSRVRICSREEASAGEPAIYAPTRQAAVGLFLHRYARTASTSSHAAHTETRDNKGEPPAAAPDNPPSGFYIERAYFTLSLRERCRSN